MNEIRIFAINQLNQRGMKNLSVCGQIIIQHFQRDASLRVRT